MRLTRYCLAAVALCLSPAAALAQDDAHVIGMTGDKDAVWIATSNNKLVYCWWPQDPSRLDRQAQCRVLDKWNIDRLQ